jgi:hypothetical protein
MSRNAKAAPFDIVGIPLAREELMMTMDKTVKKQKKSKLTVSNRTDIAEMNCQEGAINQRTMRELC